MPLLYLAQSIEGHVSREGLREIAALLGRTTAEVEAVATFYTMFRLRPTGTHVVSVCTNLACMLRGGREVYEAAHEAAGMRHGQELSEDGLFTLHEEECLGVCDFAPVAQVNFANHDRVTPERMGGADRGAARRLRPGALARPRDGELQGRVARARRVGGGAGVVSVTFERRLTRDWDDPGVIGIDGYRAKGGYEALKNALTMEPAAIIDTVKASGLRGRGGAGFPAGVKWSFVPTTTGKPTYVVVNFDESEPGTCNNRELVDRDPHRLLEGTAIAALAIGCRTAFIYVRGEYLAQGLVLGTAIREAYDAGFLGKGIAGSDVDLDIVLHRGAGAYICGEETALLNSLEGFRGQPRLRPPFPAVEGLYASPTVINNVETLMSVPDIVLRGPEWFRELGTEKSPGTKLFTISGKVERPGNYELPLGTPLAGAPRGRRRRGPRRSVPQGMDARGLVDAVAHRGPHRHAARLRVGGRGRLAARDGGRHGPGRHGLRGGCRAADDALLRPRVVREVHAVPRGDVVGGARPRPDRRRLRPRGRPAGDAGHGTAHHVPRVLRARRRRRRRDRLEPEALLRGVRGARAARGMPVAGGARGGGGLTPDTDVTLAIDGKEVTVPAGTLIIRAAEQLGIEIPRFCDHPFLEPAGACRQCYVRIEGQPKLATSCTVPVAAGMSVMTQASDDEVADAQRANLEFLLLNHPLDCPICDRGGECPLQDQALAYGPGDSRFREAKRVFKKPIPLSPLVALDRERCILCARCTRFCDQISGDRFLELYARGAGERVSIAAGEDFRSPFSGNTVQICPVGALTSAPYRFAARPFDLTYGDSVCPHCSAGCNIRVDLRRGEVVRHLARDEYEVNDAWVCDKGRYAFRFPDSPERVTTPLIRDHGLEPASFGEVLSDDRGLGGRRARRCADRRPADGRGLLRAVEARPNGVPDERPRPPARPRSRPRRG